MLVELASHIVRDSMRDQPDDRTTAERVAALAISVSDEIDKQSRAGRSSRVRMARDEEIRDAAVHEASHAVYAVSAGMRFSCAIVRDDGSGEVQTIDRGGHDFASNIMLSVVGAIGAAILQPRKSYRRQSLYGGRVDLEHVRAMIAGLPPVWRIAAGNVDMVEFFDARAAKFVVANKAKILAVADALFARRRLSEAEIKQIVDGHAQI